MASINFKGKNIIWNHHLSLPYYTLEEVKELSYQPEKADGNFIIEGDNLLALKSLLPKYTGSIKCIYIDPPYNTGNEGWIYNDKVNSPLIKEWMHKEVGNDDLTRSDKWLCMMTPRLKLLRELLKDSGIIFISIDDNEVHHLRMLMNEVFGTENFLATFVWRRRTPSALAEKLVSVDHEYVVAYQQGGFESFLGNQKDYANYKNPDNDPNGEWAFDNPTVGMTKEQRPNQFYDLIDPKTGRVYPANPNRVWAFIPETMAQKIAEGRIVFPEEEGRRPLLKRYKKDLKSGVNPISTWIKNLGEKTDQNGIRELESGLNAEGTRTIQDLFGTTAFNYAKPVSLIKSLMKHCTSNDDIILDSFAGSGTTAQSVLELNQEDGGNRKFILVQMTEATSNEPHKNICQDVTRIRAQKVIEKNKLQIGFVYQRVGVPIDAENMLSGILPSYNDFAKYVYYLATGKNLEDEIRIDESTFYVGKHANCHVFLIYKQDMGALTKMALTLAIAEQMKQSYPKEKKVIYAPACYLDEEYLEAYNIQFVSIPYNLFDRVA